MSWDSIETQCVAKDKGYGVFYQKDPNGNVIRGVYTTHTPNTKASARSFSIAGVCGTAGNVFMERARLEQRKAVGLRQQQLHQRAVQGRVRWSH